MLAEIHKSKTPIVFIKSPEYANYDIILNDVAKINRLSSQARKKRADRMLQIKVDELGLKRFSMMNIELIHLTIPTDPFLELQHMTYS